MDILRNPIFIIPALTGLTYIIAGILLYKNPPKKINSLYGYRTKASMQSQKHWDFAQILGGKEMAKCGGLLLIFSLLGFAFPDGNWYVSALAFFVSISICFIALIKTEKELKKIP